MTDVVHINMQQEKIVEKLMTESTNRASCIHAMGILMLAGSN